MPLAIHLWVGEQVRHVGFFYAILSTLGLMCTTVICTFDQTMPGTWADCMLPLYETVTAVLTLYFPACFNILCVCRGQKQD